MLTKNIYINLLDQDITKNDTKHNILSFRVYNRDWNIVEVNKDYINSCPNIPEIIKTYSNNGLSYLSYFVMVYLLNQHGGVWVDSNMYCSSNIEEWLTNIIKDDLVLLTNYKEKKFILERSFTYSSKNNYVINTLKNCLFDYLKERYDSNHNLDIVFDLIYHTDIKFKDIVDRLESKFIIKQNIPLINRDIVNISSSYIVNLKFIHIGKTGGTFLRENIEFDGQFHLRKPVYNLYDFYIIWLRNPISRFVSAFWYVYNIINTDIDNIDEENLSINNCLSPEHIISKKHHGHSYDEYYEYLINYFKSPNTLAESLTSYNPGVRKNAINLMEHSCEHLNKGIGYYLDNGNFVEKYHKNIYFVGCIENMDQDLIKLSDQLNLNLDKKTNRLRHNFNNNDKSLSQLAVKNIINYYKNTDYRALKMLLQYGFISDELYKQYHNYDSIINKFSE